MVQPVPSSVQRLLRQHPCYSACTQQSGQAHSLNAAAAAQLPKAPPLTKRLQDINNTGSTYSTNTKTFVWCSSGCEQQSLDWQQQ